MSKYPVDDKWIHPKKRKSCRPGYQALTFATKYSYCVFDRIKFITIPAKYYINVKSTNKEENMYYKTESY